MEMDGCWRSVRERRGRVTNPDSRPESLLEYVKGNEKPVERNPFQAKKNPEMVK